MTALPARASRHRRHNANQPKHKHRLSRGTLHYDVFLSHHSSDKPMVEKIAARLADEAELKQFFDSFAGKNRDAVLVGLRQAKASFKKN